MQDRFPRTAPVVASLPAAPIDGQLVQLSTDNHYYHAAGGAWKQLLESTDLPTAAGGAVMYAVSFGTQSMPANNAFTPVNVAVNGILDAVGFVRVSDSRFRNVLTGTTRFVIAAKLSYAAGTNGTTRQARFRSFRSGVIANDILFPDAQSAAANTETIPIIVEMIENEEFQLEFAHNNTAAITGTPTAINMNSAYLSLGQLAARGANGGAGVDGADGWSPILAAEADGSRRVLRVVDWTGGEGTKPATGSYIGATGFVATAAEAQDIRGASGPAGICPRYGWVQVNRITQAGEFTPNANNFGNGVAISGDGLTIAVGSPGEALDSDATQGSAGYVTIFSRVNRSSAFTQQAKLVSPSGTPKTNGFFGEKLHFCDAAGNYLVVGSWRSSGDGSGNNRGKVHVFTRTDSTWNTGFELVPSGIVPANDTVHFGFGITATPDAGTIVVGAANEPSDTGAGAVYVFSSPSAGTGYTQTQKIINTETTARFGLAVSISENGAVLAVGAYGKDGPDGVVGKGGLYVYTRAAQSSTAQFGASPQLLFGSDPDTTTTNLEIGSGQADFQFVRISADGNYIIGSGNENNGGVAYAGALYVFKNNGSNVFSQIARLTAGEPRANELMGNGLAISSAGDNIYMGPYAGNASFGASGPNALATPGRVIHFTRNAGSDEFYSRQEFTGSDTQAGDAFGENISLSTDGLTMIVGAKLRPLTRPQGANLLNYEGAAYVFQYQQLP